MSLAVLVGRSRSTESPQSPITLGRCRYASSPRSGIVSTPQAATSPFLPACVKNDHLARTVQVAEAHAHASRCVPSKFARATSCDFHKGIDKLLEGLHVQRTFPSRPSSTRTPSGVTVAVGERRPTHDDLVPVRHRQGLRREPFPTRKYPISVSAVQSTLPSRSEIATAGVHQQITAGISTSASSPPSPSRSSKKCANSPALDRLLGQVDFPQHPSIASRNSRQAAAARPEAAYPGQRSRPGGRSARPHKRPSSQRPESAFQASSRADGRRSIASPPSVPITASTSSVAPRPVARRLNPMALFTITSAVPSPSRSPSG